MATVDYHKRINQVYAPPTKRWRTRWELSDCVGHDNIRYFSYARHALVAGLRCIGVEEGDKILLPSFICRDLLSSIHAVNAVPIYYDVDKKLELSQKPDDLPNCKAIIAVNYFGFPQKLNSFKKYCIRTDAVLIEDNAHGLFGRDEDGSLLGCRGDIGIFSLRKTISTPNGAALVVTNSKYTSKLESQIEFKRTLRLSFISKNILRSLLPLIRIRGVMFLTFAIRYIRKILTGHEIPPSTPNAEIVLPTCCSAPSLDLLPLLNVVDVSEEILRRRELYIWLDSRLRGMNCKPVYANLPEGVVPYCYPFYATDNQALKINRILSDYGLECFPWPELPDELRQNSFEYYKKVWMVNFLW